MKHALLIYNPLSGSSSMAEELDLVIGRFQQKDILVQPFRFEYSSADKLNDVLKQGNYDLIIISGGDGTVNSVVNILFKAAADVPVGIIPSGTCNDFARCLNLPDSTAECIDVILSQKVTAVDVGLINEETYFLSTCAGGLFVDVSFNTDSELKKNFGRIAYYLKAISEAANLKPFSIKIRTEDCVLQKDILLFLILNGKHAAGFSNLLQEADITDGMMDMILIKHCSHVDLASLFFNVLSNKSLNDPHVEKLRAAECIFECNTDINVSIDGEKANAMPSKIRFINKALKVFVPNE
ncbi:YegS/Rv2252/BmrU family lipid kinase [Petroclostridium sp. X23]|uniref:YegS/Rv2252/BmrU family lipid kinase n=1 Tax=Petroclostridium sp. X23 TaxID=3045146 RepID=UPI0024ADE59E|nr:YegS/Rv2252/BmrU family lipid kinase [Petroclostridium sp. X23]WHH59240.1 YegS/Rv2252/BmrU family lipid kinase [Petroclostridium sp. X23]